MASSDIHIKGRGAQANTANKYLRQHYVHEHVEGLDEELYDNSATEYLEDFPKKIINVVESDDVPFGYSMNPYQGCEHG